MEPLGLASFFAAVFIYGLILLVYCCDRLEGWMPAGGSRRRVLWVVAGLYLAALSGGFGGLLAAMFILRWVLLARTPRVASQDGRSGLPEGIEDPLSGLGMIGAAEGTSSGSGDGGCHTHMPETGCGGHGGHFLGHL
jgi:hypothetical protein